MKKPPTPAPDIRLTITVTPEVHAAFVRMAGVSGMSLGRCMGEWLGDTLEGVEFVTAQMQKAREAPRQVARDLRQMALGSVDLADELLAEIRSGAASGDARSAPRTPAGPTPPRPVIRGGNSTTKPNSRGGK